MPAIDTIKIRSGTASVWSSTNPILSSGEIGYDTTNNIFKVGDGILNWNSLNSVGGGSGGSTELVYSYATEASFPGTGNASLLYFATDTGRMYRWTGSVYVEVGSLGGTEDVNLRQYFIPAAPTNVTGLSGNGQVAISWTAPTVSAQIPVTDYIIQYSSNSGSSWTTFSDGVSAATSATVTGLTNGTSYVFRVAAVNALGQGAFTAASSSATPASQAFIAPFPAGWTGTGTAADPLRPTSTTTSGGSTANGFNSASFTIARAGTLRITHPGFNIDSDCSDRSITVGGVSVATINSNPALAFRTLTRSVTAGQVLSFNAIDCYWSIYDRQFVVWLE